MLSTISMTQIQSVETRYFFHWVHILQIVYSRVFFSFDHQSIVGGQLKSLGCYHKTGARRICNEAGDCISLSVSRTHLLA